MSNLFGEECYPTPPELANKMLEGVDINHRWAVLEPSAGKGDLIKAFKSYCNEYHYRDGPDDIDAIEIDPDLRHILKGEEIRVVHNDFMTFNTYKRYDLVMMNPPFSEGAEHFAKALEFLKPGGICVCLLNAETLRNPCTNARKSLMNKLEEWEASIEYVQDAFRCAERKTGVEVAIVKAVRPANGPGVSILLEGLKRDIQMEEESEQRPRQNNTLVDCDFINAAIARFRLEIRAGLTILDEYEALKPYMLDRIIRSEKEGHDALYAKPLIELEIKHNEYIRGIRKKYWSALFENSQFTGQLTSSLQSELHNNVNRLKDYDFTRENIIALQDELGRKFITGVNDTIVDLFDEFSKRYHWADETSKNIHYFNGWKHNKAHYVNKKVITILNGFGWSFGGKIQFDWTAVSKMRDVEKILDFLDGSLRDGVSTESYFHWAEQRQQTKNIPLRHVEVTFYKKRTTHIKFTNLDALRKFNIYCCRKKNWLPPDYGITPYEDLKPEARRVIDHFSAEGEYIPEDAPSDIGEKSYRLVCSRKDLLMDVSNSVPLLGFSSV